MTAYSLYDVPYLVRESNGSYMSEKRHEIELRNQAVVDDYFIARSKGASALEVRRQIAEKYQLTTTRVKYILDWFYHEALKRRKYDFLAKFPLTNEH